VRKEIGFALDRSNNPTHADPSRSDFIADSAGGFHEEGGVWGVSSGGSEFVLPARPGSFKDPRLPGQADIQVWDTDRKVPDNPSFRGTYHVHPKGVLTEPIRTQGTSSSQTAPSALITGGTQESTSSFVQEPSPGDIQSSQSVERDNRELIYNIVVGASSGYVYFFRSLNPGGRTYIAKFPLDIFLKGL
jgi:hypothetical protein